MLDRKSYCESHFLDIAINRWIRSKHRGFESQLPEYFIELRIALEALFSDRDTRKIRSSIVRNCTQFLEGTENEKKHQYDDVLCKAYKYASEFIHARRVITTQEHGETLSDAQDICRDGILKILEKKEIPSWKK